MWDDLTLDTLAHDTKKVMPVFHQKEEFIQEGMAGNGRVATLFVNDLRFRYPDGHEALNGVSLRIERGEKVALVGPNGAGKSTLMLHLNGILGDVQGAVQVAGLALTKQNLPLIRARVGLVFQNPDDQLFSPTVFEDVAFGPLYMGLPETEIRARVAKSLAQVGMADFGERLSHHLSIGQKKRVAIATVLAMEPEILVLDEPSAGLDPRGRRALINLLGELPVTMLVSTHDMAFVQELFPRMIIMDEGRVVADGETAVLLSDEVLLETHGLERP
jgi:cobalt transport protein ATP-binding subunit